MRRPALLILDEATSALDADNEQRVRRAIEDLHSDLTVVMIGHRPATGPRLQVERWLQGMGMAGPLTDGAGRPVELPPELSSDLPSDLLAERQL